MHNPTSALENDTHKLLWDFDIQADHLISAKRPDLLIPPPKKKKQKEKKEREFAKLSTLLSRLTTEQNRKKVKRMVSTSTLLGN